MSELLTDLLPGQSQRQEVAHPIDDPMDRTEDADNFRDPWWDEVECQMTSGDPASERPAGAEKNEPRVNGLGAGAGATGTPASPQPSYDPASGSTPTPGSSGQPTLHGCNSREPPDDAMPNRGRSSLSRKVTSRKSHSADPIGAAFNHRWQPVGRHLGSWRCTACSVIANTGMRECPKLEGCPGWSTVLACTGSGHSLLTYRVREGASGHSQAYACRLCHRTSTGKPVFDEPCDQAPTAVRSLAFRRLERGQHPHYRWGGKIIYTQGSLTQVDV